MKKKTLFLALLTGLPGSASAAWTLPAGAASLAAAIAMAALVTALFVYLLKLLSRLHVYAELRLSAWAASAVKGVKLQQVQLLTAERITEWLIFLLNALRVLLTLVLIYFYLPILFSFFPWTRGLAGELFGYVLRPLKELTLSFLGYIPDMIFVAVTVVCVHYFLRFLYTITREVARGRVVFKGFYPDWAVPTFQIARFIIWAFTLVIIFPYLPGSDSPAFKGVSVFLGVLFSLGSSSAIANAVAGIIITYMRPFKRGDRVKIVDTVGNVMEKTLLVTRVKTVKNEHVTIPNALVLGSHIVNYTAQAEGESLILHTSVTIGYDVPWRKVHELLVASARAAEGVSAEPAPFVYQTALNDFHVSYELNAYAEKADGMAAVYSSLHQNIQDKFAEAGVEILSPAYSALRGGRGPVLPPKPA
ncbi:MAG TPA: mechanosensitive ion channel protein [Elusimicrobia bacterium]|nr:mechanosensitive ion channel protein [Elusimicrobiota bacterium]